MKEIEPEKGGWFYIQVKQHHPWDPEAHAPLQA